MVDQPFGGLACHHGVLGAAVRSWVIFSLIRHPMISSRFSPASLLPHRAILQTWGQTSYRMPIPPLSDAGRPKLQPGHRYGLESVVRGIFSSLPRLLYCVVFVILATRFFPPSETLLMEHHPDPWAPIEPSALRVDGPYAFQEFVLFLTDVSVDEPSAAVHDHFWIPANTTHIALPCGSLSAVHQPGAS